MISNGIIRYLNDKVSELWKDIKRHLNDIERYLNDIERYINFGKIWKKI